MHATSTFEEPQFSMVKSTSTSAEQGIRNCSKKKNRMSHSFQVCSNAFHNLTASLSNIRLSSSTSSSGTNSNITRKTKTSVKKKNSNASDSDNFSSGQYDSTLGKGMEKGDSSRKVGKEYTCDEDAVHYSHSRVKCYSVYDDTDVVEDFWPPNGKRGSCYFGHHVSRSEVTISENV